MVNLEYSLYNSEEDVSHLYRWRVPYLLTGGEHISPASLKRQEEVLPAAKLEQRRYNETYEYDVKENPGEEDWCHGHTFESVLMALLRKPEHFNVEAYKEQYSQQQIDMIKAVRARLQAMEKKDKL